MVEISVQKEVECLFANSRFLQERKSLPSTFISGKKSELQRSRQWMQDAGLDQQLFDRKLRSENISEAEFDRLLAGRGDAGWEPTDCMTDPLPSWLVNFLSVTRSPPVIREEVSQALLTTPVAFAAALAGFVQTGLDLLCNRLCDGAWHSINRPVVYAQFARHLLKRLAIACERVLVLELNVARLEGRLLGETGKERFDYYVSLFSNGGEEWQRIFAEYPLLARRIYTAIDVWVDSTAEFFTHLREDWSAIQNCFLDSDANVKLENIDLGLSDSHRGGRSVALLQFSFEDAKTAWRTVVYKPRSLEVDCKFQQLLSWFNENGKFQRPPFRLTQIIVRPNRGWVEFVEYLPCHSSEELRLFYMRQGALLAVLHLIGGADFHQENLIACGPHPILVDLEALFHANSNILEKPDAVTAVTNFLSSSVMRVGLLPYQIWGDDVTPGVDISGLGTIEEQQSPEPWPTWSGTGSDEMKEIKQHVALPTCKNIPKINGNFVAATAFGNELVTGFRSVCSDVLAEKPALLADDGPIAAFAVANVRYIARPTMFYSRLLRDANHPDNLRDALDHELLLDKLWIVSRERTELDRLVSSEKCDLRQNDVPYFSSRVDSRDLQDSNGLTIRDFFASDMLSSVRATIKNLSDSDVDKQIAVIKSSLSASIIGHMSKSGSGDSVAASAKRHAVRGQQISKDELLHCATILGDRLANTAFLGTDDVAWLCMSRLREDRWQLQPMNGGLYDGIAGITIFFAWLARVTKSPRFADIALRGTRTLVRSVTSGSEFGIGAYCGITSQIYALSHLHHFFPEEKLLDVASTSLSVVGPRISTDNFYDVLGGSAGAIVALLKYWRQSNDALALELAIACGDRLSNNAIELKSGIGWTPAHQRRPLLGFSHGNAGIAWALGELSNAIVTSPRPGPPIERIVALKQNALHYERSCFSDAQQNWPDFRCTGAGQDPDHFGFFVAWCHGASGIALARLLTPGPIDEFSEGEIVAGINTTLKIPYLNDHSLCHGEMGNLLIADRAAARLGRDDWKVAIDQRLNRVITDVNDGIFRCGVPGSIDSPGLLTGLSGIGLGFLKFAFPGLVPDILAMELPDPE